MANKHTSYISRRRTQWITENGPCRSCGSWENLQVHHKDPANKTGPMRWEWAEAKRAKELATCEVLCAACHREHHRANPAPRAKQTRHADTPLGRWLKHEKDLSYREAAVLIGISHAELGHIITGTRKPQIETLKALWRGLEMPQSMRVDMARDYVRSRELEILAMKEACQDDLQDD